MGDRFNGDHFVSGVLHEIGDGNWITTAEIGLSSSWFAQENDVMSPCAGGQLPGIENLCIGTVMKIDSDPDSEYRVQINLPLLDPDANGIWARLVNFYSSAGCGVFFSPEVDDEVVVGFLGGDPRYPIVLGSLYSSKRKPSSDLDPDSYNSMKAIVSKSGLRITFDDKNIVLSVITPANNTLVLDDKNKKVSMIDQNNNSIEMSSDGITIKSPKSITI